MAATPSDIAKYTQDGVTVSWNDAALKTLHPLAKDQGEIVTFLRYAADAQVLLDERVAIQSAVGGLHEMIEVEESMGVGTDLAVTPSVPCFTVIDDIRGINAVGRTRATAFDMNIDRYSLEFVG